MAYPIIDEIAGRWLSMQGCLFQAGDPAVTGLFQPTGELMYYEVIRVVRGVPLFWEDHLARLARSSGGNIELPRNLYAQARSLIAANGIPDANLRLVLTAASCVMHLTASYYPSAAMVKAGVPTGVLAWERENPNTKIINSDYKAAVAGRFAQPGPFGPYFELLLADSKGFLTEGSRSNLFFIRGGEVVSAPDSRILLGITRKYVRQAIADAGSSLVSGLLTLEEIRQGACKAAFLTGSPIDLLPVSSIEECELASGSHPLLKRINSAYLQIVDRYVQDRMAPGRSTVQTALAADQ